MWRGYLTTAIYRDHLLRHAHPHEGRALWRTLATAKRLDKVRSRLVEVSLSVDAGGIRVGAQSGHVGGVASSSHRRRRSTR